jgi:hypothetical protein
MCETGRSREHHRKRTVGRGEPTHDRNQEPAQEGFELEISTLPQGEGEDARFLAARPSPRRARIWRRALKVCTLLLLLVVILGVLPPTRSQVVELVQRFLPIPTSPLPPGADRFYVDPDVPWTTVTLDGRPLRLPRIGAEAPLQLARGRHMLAWTAAPFQPQRCLLTVPPTPAASCPLIDEVRHGAPGRSAFVVGLHESLDTLPGDQQVALIQAAQRALSGFSAIVQPGEAYVIESDNPVPNAFPFVSVTAIATQPLHATLQLQLDTTSTAEQSCLLSVFVQIQNCALSDENCARWCTMPWQTLQAEPLALGQQAWLTVAVLSPPTWSYATPDGQTIAQNEPLDASTSGGREPPVLLRIAWEGGLAWQVQPLFGPNQGPPILAEGSQVTDDPACLSAEELFPEDFTTYAQLRFSSGPNPAAGCLIEATLAQHAQTPTPTSMQVEEYLVRFGVVVAVTSQAQRRHPQWPIAVAYEQQLARQLATLPGGLTVTSVP